MLSLSKKLLNFSMMFCRETSQLQPPTQTNIWRFRGQNRQRFPEYEHREEIYQRGNTRQIVSRRYIQSIYYRKLY
jgi:hypothetical protein